MNARPAQLKILTDTDTDTYTVTASASATATDRLRYGQKTEDRNMLGRGPIIAKSRRKNARDEAINCIECSLMQFAGDPLLARSLTPVSPSPTSHSASVVVAVAVAVAAIVCRPSSCPALAHDNNNCVSFSRSIFGLAKPALSCRLE